MKFLTFLFVVLPLFIYSQENTNSSYYLATSMSQNGKDPIDIKIPISINLDDNKIIIHLDEPLRFDIESTENVAGAIQYNCIDPYNDNWMINVKIIDKITAITFFLDFDSYFTYSCKQIYDEE
jgi:hypothetical protein